MNHTADNYNLVDNHHIEDHVVVDIADLVAVEDVVLVDIVHYLEEVVKCLVVNQYCRVRERIDHNYIQLVVDKHPMVVDYNMMMDAWVVDMEV